MSDDVFSPVFPRYGTSNSASQARTDVGTAFETLEAAEFHLVELVALLLGASGALGASAIVVPDALQLSAFRGLSLVRGNSFEALRSLARVFNRVEGDEAIFTKPASVFELLNGLDHARRNVSTALESIVGFSMVLSQIREASRFPRDPEDAAWWRDEPARRHATALNRMKIARECLDAAVASTLVHEQAPWLSGLRRETRH